MTGISRRGRCSHSSSDAHLPHLAPADVELIAGGHVGHRAAGREVRQDDFLMRRAEDVGALGHEVHAAEHDELGLALAGGGARELQRVAGEVGELDDLVALIVMAEDHQALAERLLGRRNPRVHLVVGEAQVVLRERLPLADALLLDLVEELDVHCQSDLGVRTPGSSGSQLERVRATTVQRYWPRAAEPLRPLDA